jgi:hypothetical protein
MQTNSLASESLSRGQQGNWRGNRNDDAPQISELADLNARIRTEETRNLIEAARRSGSPKILAQSVAWHWIEGRSKRGDRPGSSV